MDAIHSGDTAAQARIEAEFDVADQAERTRDLLAAALYYATRWAWPVFPLRPGDKRPLTEHGFKDASRDPDRIRAWWKATPQANIGVPTGLAFDVLDVDWRRSDGSPSDVGETWEKLREHPTALPDIHGQAITARSGLHVLFEPQKGENNRQGSSWKGVAVPGLDYRGLGGYVVVAPSRAVVGYWAWTIRPSPRITTEYATKVDGR